MFSDWIHSCWSGFSDWVNTIVVWILWLDHSAFWNEKLLWGGNYLWKRTTHTPQKVFKYNSNFDALLKTFFFFFFGVCVGGGWGWGRGVSFRDNVPITITFHFSMLKKTGWSSWNIQTLLLSLKSTPASFKVVFILFLTTCFIRNN